MKQLSDEHLAAIAAVLTSLTERELHASEGINEGVGVTRLTKLSVLDVLIPMGMVLACKSLTDVVFYSVW